VAVGLLIGALGAAASLGAGLVKSFQQRRKAETSDAITVTVRHGAEMIEKQGTIRSSEVSTVLAMVDDEPVPPAAGAH
jgi:hypothetical protein